MEEFVDLFKEADIRAGDRAKNYKFDYIRRFCIKNNICSFSKKCAAKKDIRNTPYLELNRVFHMLIKNEPHEQNLMKEI